MMQKTNARRDPRRMICESGDAAARRLPAVYGRPVSNLASGDRPGGCGRLGACDGEDPSAPICGADWARCATRRTAACALLTRSSVRDGTGC